MRRLGKHTIYNPSSAPCVVVVLYDSLTNLPLIVWTQESQTDVALIKLDGVLLECLGILDDINIQSVRPQSGGGMRRTTATLSFNTNQVTAAPLIDNPFGTRFYSCGRNFDDLYFAIYSIDRSALHSDIKLGAMYGIFKLDNEVSWDEKDGVQDLSLIDILVSQDAICGAKSDEVVPDLFFIYNPWYTANFMPKAYGQVPRIKVLNAFPSFSIKTFAAGITGKVQSDYDDTSTEILLEDNVDQSSLLLQAAELGGTVRIKMHDGEVIAGTLDYDSVAQTITLVITIRNTYYNQVAAYNDSLDGRTPDQWGPHPNWTDTRYSPTQTVIPNAREVIMDQNGFMQADIWFYRDAEAQKGLEFDDVVCQIQGILDERKDVVIHSYWPDPDYPTTSSVASISGYYTNVDNGTYLPPDSTPLWAVAAYQVLKFYDEPRMVRLFFNNPDISIPGEGVIGDNWQMVFIEPDEVDTSCYIRNGYSLFSVDHVFVEGEGKLIRVPPANVTITQSGTFYGLTNMTKIALTDAPLDMNIGAKSNTVYVDCLYRVDETTDSRTEKILFEILSQEAPHLVQFADANLNGYAYPEENFLPYIGWVCKEETKVTDILDKVCYQAGITFRWDYGLFSIDITGRVFGNVETIEIAEDVFAVRPLCLGTDENEMLEKTAGIRIGKLKTSKYTDGDNEEYIPLYFKATYGGWEDPFYPTTKPQTNRNIKPDQRVVEYHFDLLNDQASFSFAIASCLSSGHPSGYGLAQRKVLTDMSLDGCRWEAMDPITFKRFPGISLNTDWTSYDDNDNVIWPAREDNKPYLVASHCNVDSVTYAFSIKSPVVQMIARVCQFFVEAGGINVYAPPSVPNLPDSPSEDPNAPPNTNAGGSGYYWLGGMGTSYLMPLIWSDIPTIEINSLDTEEEDFTLTVDAGWIYDKGFTYRAYVEEPHSTGGEANLASFGAELDGASSGAFADKTNDSYVPAIYDLTLRVNWRWFQFEGLGTTTRQLKIVVVRTYQISRSPGSPFESDVQFKMVNITRLELAGVEGS